MSAARGSAAERAAQLAPGVAQRERCGRFERCFVGPERASRSEDWSVPRRWSRDCQFWRSAWDGLMRPARNAGTAVAMSAHADTARAARAMICHSKGLTW